MPGSYPIVAPRQPYARTGFYDWNLAPMVCATSKTYHGTRKQFPGLAPGRVVRHSRIVDISFGRIRKSMFSRPFIIRLCIFSLLATSCRGALEWENLQVTESAWAGDKKAVAVYRFRNSGASPITLSSIQTSCGCTTVEIAKRTYDAGESGELSRNDAVGSMFSQQMRVDSQLHCSWGTGLGSSPTDATTSRVLAGARRA